MPCPSSTMVGRQGRKVGCGGETEEPREGVTVATDHGAKGRISRGSDACPGPPSKSSPPAMPLVPPGSTRKARERAMPAAHHSPVRLPACGRQFYALPAAARMREDACSITSFPQVHNPSDHRHPRCPRLFLRRPPSSAAPAPRSFLYRAHLHEACMFVWSRHACSSLCRPTET